MSSSRTNSVFYDILYNAVRSVDANHTIFVEAFYDFNYFADDSEHSNNTVAEFHFRFVCCAQFYHYDIAANYFA